MKVAIINTATNFKKTHDGIISKAKENLSKEELEAQRDKFVNKAAEELTNKIETGFKDSLETEVVSEIFTLIQKRKDSSENITDESIPFVLQKMLRDNQLLGGYHDWNWRKDYRDIINNLLNRYPKIKAEYESNLKKIIEMLKNTNFTETQIRIAATEMSNFVKLFV